MKFGKGWQQPSCPVSPTPAPPYLPLECGEPHRQLGLLLGTAGKTAVTGPGHRTARTTYAVSQSLPLKGPDAEQGRQGDARIHKCTGTNTVHRHWRVHTYSNLAPLFLPTLFTGKETEAHRGGVTCPRSLHCTSMPCQTTSPGHPAR